MSIFKIKNHQLVRIKEKNFDYEKDLQKLVEQNLKEIFGLDFVSGALNKEFSIKSPHQSFYIDTLAFDPEINSFVIIEYKKDKNLSVIDQGYAYLAAMLNNKAEFVLEYNERKKINLNRDNIDWSQAKVIFVAKEFTPYQMGAIAFKDLPIELWEVQLLEDNIISFSQIKPAETQESITKITKSHTVKEVSREVKTYTIENHYKKASPITKVLLDKLRQKISLLDENIKEAYLKNYIGYKSNWYNFVSIHIFKDKLKIYVRKDKLLKDVDKKFIKVPESYGWGKTPLWWIDISKDNELNYVINVIKESYEASPDR